MSGSTSGMKQSTTETQSVKGGEKQQSTTCGCESTGKCSCPPNQCTCPNCPREDAAKRGVDKQSATKPGEVSGEATKLPSVESAGIDIGKPLTLGGALNLSSITQFPSESDRAALDSSLSGPLNSLLEIRDCLVKHLNEGSFNEENIKACADQLDHWEGKYRSKEGVFAASGADFSSKMNQIPKGQEIIQQILHQIRDLQSVIKQRFEVGCVKGVGFSAMSGQQRQGGGEVGAEMGGTGTKKAAQVTELGTERY